MSVLKAWNIKRFFITLVVVFVPIMAVFFGMMSLTFADPGDEEPYSVFILAGQSWAEGTNSFRVNLPAGTGIDKQNHPADTATGFWWAGADGNGPDTLLEYIEYFNGISPAGWMQSGGVGATGANSYKNMNDVQRLGQFGPELSMARKLYDNGRRKVIILKVSYGFQSLAQSTSPTIPFDFNSAPGRNKSYDRMKTEFNALTNYLKSTNKKYTVDGFYWYQGGTDALQQSYTDQYEQNLRDLITRSKTDFQFSSNAHFVMAKFSLRDCYEKSYPLTGDYCGFPYMGQLDPLTVAPDFYTAHSIGWNRMEQVRGIIQKVADDDNNGVMKVDAVEDGDLTRAGDRIHLNEASNIIMGQRFVSMFNPAYQPSTPSSDYDGDGIINNNEDVGRGAGCQLPYSTQNNSNLGDDDSDCDGYPNYIDKLDGSNGNGLGL